MWNAPHKQRAHVPRLDEADEWAKKILEVTKQERKAEIDKIRAAGYDVHDVAEYLEDFYIKKYLEN